MSHCVRTRAATTTLPFGARLGAMQEVTLIHDSDHAVVVVDDGDAADPVLQKKLRRFTNEAEGFRVMTGEP